ncbi:MAG: CAP domain-containing protein [Spirochaetia bacterium]|nr:CAP domain-containing protein [Spirochaetia bacterium]
MRLFFGFAISLFIILVLDGAVFAQNLSDAPPAQEPARISSVKTRAMGLTVDTKNRASVAQFYREVYKKSAASNGWTGNVSSCRAGANSSAYQDATALRINYFRAMAGLPADVTLKSDLSDKDTKAALMFEANNSLSHGPPASWTCYSKDGAEAAANSNIALGASGPNAIDLYVYDPGSGNYFVGHRRWIFYPRQLVMGSGSTARANALWVFGEHKQEAPNVPFVAWPNAGFTPRQLFTARDYRWSYSISKGDFQGSSVKLSCGGKNIPVRQEQYKAGYGENTLVWVPTFSAGVPVDTACNVEIGNVKISGQTTTQRYSVTFIDGEAQQPGPTEEVKPDQQESVSPWKPAGQKRDGE